MEASFLFLDINLFAQFLSNMKIGFTKVEGNLLKM